LNWFVGKRKNKPIKRIKIRYHNPSINRKWTNFAYYIWKFIWFNQVWI